ncbi:hypothetical protein BD779DRAFT_1786347 [Infundibulicybe gibba]|nr:hypothetical protein BD779DRAFT_1786347 [Infundibulicybe gibba]
MSYVNPLHPPVRAAHRSSYTTLAGAVYDPNPGPRFPVPHRQHLPQQLYAPSSKWVQAMGRGKPSSYSIITMRDKSSGASMAELCAPSPPAPAKIASGDKVLFTVKKNITLHILWPGYDRVECSRSFGVGPGTTLAVLVSEFSKMFSRYIEINKFVQSSRPEFQIAQPGHQGIYFNQLILLSVHEPFEDHWQADVAFELPY